MARATTKADLIQAANQKYQKLCEMIRQMPEQQQNTDFDFEGAFAQKEAHWKRDKNLRDVIVHLYEWHQLLLNWVEVNQKGTPASFLPKPYNWKTYGDMNLVFWEKHQKTQLGEAVKQLDQSHRAVMKMIERFTNEQLFSKGAYDWTGSTTLGSYCVSATASHYDWAIKKLKAHQKTYKKA